MNTPFQIRAAVSGDLARINQIYNHYVLSSTCTFQTEPETLESRQDWFANRTAAHPVLVAEGEGSILGWGAVSPYKSRAAYRFTGEVGVYVDPDFHRQGIGKALLEGLIGAAREEGLRSLVASIAADQEPSLQLHRALGFREVGRLKAAGFKFDRWLDVLLMQLMIPLGEGREKIR